MIPSNFLPILLHDLHGSFGCRPPVYEMSSDAAVLQIGLGVESGQIGTDPPKVVL